MNDHTKKDTYQSIHKCISLIEDSYINFNANVHTNLDINERNEISDFLEEPNHNDNSSSDLNLSSDSNDHNIIKKSVENNNGVENNEINKIKKKTKNLEKYKILKQDNDIKLAVKISIQCLLKNQPFPVKREDLFSVINNYVPNCNSNLKKKVVLKLLKKYVSDILSLKLLTLSSHTKTEYVLSQTIYYKPHNDFLYSELDHNIRGFLIFLIPFFKIYHNKLPLSFLLNELETVGHTTSKPPEEILKLLNAQHLFANIVTNINLYKELVDPIDYIIYSKKLSYIDFTNDQHDNKSLDGLYCVPTLRFEYEVNNVNYIDELLNISNRQYQLKDLYVMFEDKYFMNLNYNSL
ncbi:hypothetical protein YYG_03428 [Plasmodium vinckei petteri]|uniref:Uncharacterized protein n=1 Tax=Plasmodium vinckei petteri TaxID=138298 RepID=W7B0R0_PLAVN|nr:hypothetical protein YYG_03428 [Plasmodium vinckei petteri]CAD2111401.1 conserved Plasmodium protein, unknown function [Plasmodium vinckei petteri]